MAAPAYDVHHHGPDRRRHLPAERRPAGGRHRVLALPRRHGDERRRRRGPAGPTNRRHHEGRRRPVRPLRDRRAPGLRSRHPPRTAARPTLPTPVVFAELDPPEEPRIWFYRYPKAPDMTLVPDDLDAAAIRAVGPHLLGHGHRALRRAEPDDHDGRARERDPRALTRPRSRLAARALARPELAPERYRRGDPPCIVVVGNRAESPSASASSSPRRPPRAARDRRRACDREARRRGRACRDRGGRGGRRRRSGWRSSTAWARVTRSAARCAIACWPATPPPTRSGSPTPPGAHVVARLACADAMPTEDEVLELLEASHAG